MADDRRAAALRRLTQAARLGEEDAQRIVDAAARALQAQEDGEELTILIQVRRRRTYTEVSHPERR
ncbi:MAG: hypothetical protein AAF845_05660 [Bacteroidota bacterium]